MRKNLLKTIFATSLSIVVSLSILLPSNLVKAESKINTTQDTKSAKASSIPDKILVGYWHNFDNGTGTIKLRDVSPAWDVINLSFGEPTTVTSGDIKFQPVNATENEFKEDVKYLQSQGKKVLLSIGGQNGQVQLTTDGAKNTFIKSVSEIIDKYGLDGLDIDFEGHSLYFNAGDRDFKNPKTPVIVNLIDALKQLTSKYGDNFVLTMAPETFFVQMGRTYYGGSNSNVDNRCGSYLPVIYAMRDELDWLQVQYYNSGTIKDINGKDQSMGSPEFYVSLADMLLTGFYLNNEKEFFFPPLREDQVVIGVPAAMGAGNGTLSNADVEKAMNALINGGTVGGYTVSKPYPELRGLMTWSINWDKTNNYGWSTYFRNYFDKLYPPISTLKSAELSSSTVKNGSFTLTAKVPSRNTATSYKIFENGNEIFKGTLTPDQTSVTTITKDISKTNISLYEYTIVLYDNTSSVTSNKVIVDTTPIPNTAPAINGVTSKNISRGSTFNPLSGVTAVDKEDGDITKNIVVTGTVNTSVAGKYEITYTVTDSEGLKATAKAIITVEDNGSIGPDTYDPTKVYNGGEIVVYNGIRYRAKWWTQNDLPGTNDVWEKLDGGSGSSDILDLTTVANKYNTKKTDIGYESRLDRNNDGVIDIFDLVLVAKTL